MPHPPATSATNKYLQIQIQIQKPQIQMPHPPATSATNIYLQIQIQIQIQLQIK